MTERFEISAIRRNYAAQGMRRADLDPNPVAQFLGWFTSAVEAEIPDVNAMTLATVSPVGQPSARVVLLKGVDHEGFVFFTNYSSDKGRQMEANPHVALGFFWVQLERQVRVEGVVTKTSREESVRYFHSRPIASQLGAWASDQSEPIDGRQVLDARLAQMTERFGDGEIPCPPHWGGYRVVPSAMEFWQGRPNRLHDRFRYTRDGDAWTIARLAP